MFSSAIRTLTVGLTAGFLAWSFASSPARAQLANNPTLAAEQANENDNSLPFRGSSFTFSQSLTATSFTKSDTLSYNPTYSWGFGVSLFWHFNERLSLNLTQELQVELTDSDSTLTKREPLLSDTSLGLNALIVRQEVSPKFQWSVNGSGGLIAPTSRASQGATMVLATRVGAIGTATFPKVVNGFSASLSLGYLHRFLRSNVAEPTEPYPCSAGSASLTLCNQMGGRSNARLGITAGVSAALSLNDKWALAFGLQRAWRRGADLADFTYVSDDGLRVPLRDGSLNHWRNNTTLTLGVNYAVLQWLGLGLSAVNSFAERGIDGQYRGPFNANDMFFGLDLGIRLDEVYLMARGRKN